VNKAMARRIPLGLLCLLAQLTAASDTDGRGIMEKVFGQDRTGSRVVHATLQVFEREGRSTSKRFVEYRIGTEQGSKALLMFTEPAEIRGLQVLSISTHGALPEEWIMSPTTHRARKIAAPDRAARFADSDFSYEELSNPVLADFNYHLLPETHTVNGHAAWLIEAVPVNAGRSQYNKVRYRVAKDIPCILTAEMFDSEGRMVRTVVAADFARRSGVWGPRRVEARSVLEGTRSILTVDAVQFNAGLTDELFTPQAMEAGRTPRSAE